MNQIKVGSFMRELRKEKGLTQEQLAEQFNVSNRTVSRWENGGNMPDLDILIEMSDFYGIELRELLNGERKSEKMNEELNETVLMVADYSNEEKKKLLFKIHTLSIIGLVGFVVFLIVELLGLGNTPPYETIASFCLGVPLGMFIGCILLTSRHGAKIRNMKKRLVKKMVKEKQ